MITILRLGHRLGRDARVSTHVGLAARAFGADSIVYSGDHDEKMMESVRKVVGIFGGPFPVEYEKDWKTVIENWKGNIVHLTMYGENQKDVKIPKDDLLVIIGSEKVPPEVYDLVDFNISVKNQPHSEISALGVFLDRMNIKKDYKNARKMIKPSKRGKIIE